MDFKENYVFFGVIIKRNEKVYFIFVNYINFSFQNIITNEENERNTKSRTKSTPKKTKMTTRLQKREWFDSDEENSEKDQPPAKYFIRSRSLGPRDLQVRNVKLNKFSFNHFM